MKCNRCGKEVNEKDSFCLYCGNTIKKELRIKKQNKKDQKLDNIEETDKTLFVAGKTALVLLPISIYGIIMLKNSLADAHNPSVEFFGPLPELLIASYYFIIASLVVLIPIIIIIIGTFTGTFRTKIEKANNNKDK